MLKKITIYTGSFKPPHKGHLFLVKKMLKMTTPENKKDYLGIVYIFISIYCPVYCVEKVKCVTVFK